MPRLTTFPARGEFEKAVALLEGLGAPFQTLSPEPAFCRVGVPAIIVEPEALRVHANEAWTRRAEIEPSWETRERPPALEILKRLPRTNCGACGEPTCLAFAVKVWSGEAPLEKCKPVFEGSHGHLREALLQVAGALVARQPER